MRWAELLRMLLSAEVQRRLLGESGACLHLVTPLELLAELRDRGLVRAAMLLQFRALGPHLLSQQAHLFVQGVREVLVLQHGQVYLHAVPGRRRRQDAGPVRSLARQHGERTRLEKETIHVSAAATTAARANERRRPGPLPLRRASPHGGWTRGPIAVQRICNVQQPPYTSGRALELLAAIQSPTAARFGLVLRSDGGATAPTRQRSTRPFVPIPEALTILRLASDQCDAVIWWSKPPL
eukprot:scaffold626_cov409-Prasinococcus_capsulatus_cf.AAC.23